METNIRKATLSDLTDIQKFTDFWLAGRGKRVNAPGATNDCFISPSQHTKYIQKYTTFLMFTGKILAGWAVTQNNGALIHFLIAGNYREQGLGHKLLKHVSPLMIHSKSNQQSGNPGPFYEKLGYTKIESRKSHSRLDIDKIRPNRPKVIDIYAKIA